MISGSVHRHQAVKNPRTSDGFWVHFAATMEVRRHLGRQARAAIIGNLSKASSWAMWHLSIDLGLMDEAWSIQKQLSPGYHVGIPKEPDRSLAEYALWLLGRSLRRPASVADVSPHCRLWLYTVLGRRAAIDRDLAILLGKIAQDEHHPDRCRAICSLGQAANRGQEEAFALLVQVASDRGDPLQHVAMSQLSPWYTSQGPEMTRLLLGRASQVGSQGRAVAVEALQRPALREATDGSYRGTLDLLLDIVSDPADPARGAAIKGLGRAAGVEEQGHLRNLLATVLKDPDDPDRGSTVQALGSVLRQLESTTPSQAWATELLFAVAQNRADSSRAAALDALRWCGSLLPSNELELLLAVAQDRHDPERGVAIEALSEVAAPWEFVELWSIGDPEPARPHELLLSIASDRDDPDRHTAIAALGNVIAGQDHPDPDFVQLLLRISHTPDDPGKGLADASLQRACAVSKSAEGLASLSNDIALGPKP